MKIEHKGFEQFRQGVFGNGGDNLFVDAGGTIRRIMDNDLNGKGTFDIVLPNSHGYIERAPTYIYTNQDGAWIKTQLPHDSCWMSKAVDVDGDGYLDLIVVNGENGVTSELKSYIYWGGASGLTGECTALDTIGAYDVAVCDINGDGRKDIIFTTAWFDHHNGGIPMNQKVYIQSTPRQFTDATEVYNLPGVATVSLLCEDLNGDGYPELVLANYREQYEYDTESFIYWGGPDGFDAANVTRLPTHFALQVMAADLNGDGFKELIFTGGNQLMIYWNAGGVFQSDNRLVLNITGTNSQFSQGILPLDIADIDADGIPELVIGTAAGVEIRKAGKLDSVWQKLPCYGVTGIKAADIGNIGLMDIIASHYCSTKSYDTESLVFWSGEEGYSASNTTAFATHGPMGCTAADLDNDGVKEIIFCNTMRGPSQYDPEFPVFVYYGTADHQYEEANRKEYPIPIMSHSYAVADVDNDGYVELIATTGNGVRIFKGTPDGPDPAQYYDLNEMRAIGGVLIGDFNRDGWLDLIVTPWMYSSSDKDLAQSVFIYFGGPEGYSNERRQSLPSNIGCAQAVLLADIDNDGYIDFLYGDNDGFVGVHYGGPDGFSGDRVGKIQLKDPNGALILGLAAADVDKDGWPELFVTTAGHYSRKKSHLYYMRDGKSGFPLEKTVKFETGGSTGFPSVADMNRSGNLDLLLPFYSTTETRELPARIFSGDGRGNFDWEHPLEIECLSSIAFSPVDLTGNGYPDLFICCHRNDIGHIVHSKLIMNGPDGLRLEKTQEILGYGPHSFTAKNQGNALDRSEDEHYTSPVFECAMPKWIDWQAETPFRTSLVFRLRYGASVEETMNAVWSGTVDTNGSEIQVPEGTKFMQYQIAFRAPGLVSSPKLTVVTIECG
ncbi:FG-GAP repeat domain-containing protein [Paenibacillus nasutitermitis]|uniref:VCBS repeat-containing protein n=1 Tax=Paenibacillus nasutitermitis TaxID=1652958 RepID=A0A916YMG5_9BACL|nr:VCBS repeat-containing protein [Paenibacillus nasutitermitis]GGD51881.1 hypothetical protein GCM10010911_06820 [Paenibacillus nasutitermitis]